MRIFVCVGVYGVHERRGRENKSEKPSKTMTWIVSSNNGCYAFFAVGRRRRRRVSSRAISNIAGARGSEKKKKIIIIRRDRKYNNNNITDVACPDLAVHSARILADSPAPISTTSATDRKSGKALLRARTHTHAHVVFARKRVITYVIFPSPPTTRAHTHAHGYACIYKLYYEENASNLFHPDDFYSI